jgi:uncharacterized phosphosugar-binding protein
MLDRYADAASSALGEVAATQGQALEEAARLVAASVAAGGVLHVFGAGVVAALCARVAELLEERGQTPPVLASQNLDGPSVADHNAALVARYADRAGEGAP